MKMSSMKYKSLMNVNAGFVAAQIGTAGNVSRKPARLAIGLRMICAAHVLMSREIPRCCYRERIFKYLKMATTKVKETQCVSCKHKIEAATAVHGNRTPGPGSISICAYCGMPGVYTDAMDIRPLTEVELQRIKRDEPHLYQMLMEGQRIILERNKNN
jgi:hypothetical protein